MNKHGNVPGRYSSKVIIPPAYPFSARDLLSELRLRIAKEERSKVSLARLAKMIGQPTSTTHHWFAIYRQPHLLALMTLLERLSIAERHAYIDAHCRSFPSLTDPRLARNPSQITKLQELLRRTTGLDIVTGNEPFLTFITTAVGHAYSQVDGEHRSVAGIDIHRPNTFVPVEGMYYLDPMMGAKSVRGLLAELLPKVLTSRSRLLILNGVWSLAPESRIGLMRCSAHKHVILAERRAPQASELRDVCKLNSLIAVSKAKGDIRID